MSKSNIQWTDATWNAVIGCTKVSEGCRHCYAMTMAARLASMADADDAAGRNPGRKAAYQGVVRRATDGRTNKAGKPMPLPQWNNTVACVEEALTIPLRTTTPTRFFVDSMGDWFHEGVPFAFLDRLWAVMALCPHHVFQVLTKRPERMAAYLRDCNRAASVMQEAMSIAFEQPDGHPAHAANDLIAHGALPWPLSNVWLGTSCEDQKAADERIPHLLECPAAVRFLSCEPLLGAIDLSGFMGGAYVVLPGDRVEPSYNFGIDWVIAGGESGHGARACDVGWIRSIVAQCRGAGVPCFVKQLGAKPYEDSMLATWPGTWAPHVECHLGDPAPAYESYTLRHPHGGDWDEWPEDLRVRELPAGVGNVADAGEKGAVG